MNRQMWQPSVAETNFSPVKMISSSIYPGGPVRDEINKSAAVPPVQQPWTMPDKGTTIRRRMTADPFERLHGSLRRTILKFRLEMKLAPISVNKRTYLVRVTSTPRTQLPTRKA